MLKNGALGDRGATCHQVCQCYSVAKQATSAIPVVPAMSQRLAITSALPVRTVVLPSTAVMPFTTPPHAMTRPLAAAGLFLAPQMVGEALKGGRLVAEVLSRAGFKCLPAAGMPPTHSFITAVEMGSREHMVAFCRAVQQCCPVGSYVRPEPGEQTDEEALLSGCTTLLPCGVTSKCSKTPLSGLVTVACCAALCHPAWPSRFLLGQPDSFALLTSFRGQQGKMP